MARLNWSKNSGYRRAAASLREQASNDAYLRELDRAASYPPRKVYPPSPKRKPRKQYMREVAEDMVEEAQAWGEAPTRKLPTFLMLNCPCGHSKRVWFHGKRPRYRCSQCGRLAL